MIRMFGAKKDQLNVLVLRDADVVAAALRQALAEAGPEERPGLERALRVVARAAEMPDDALRSRWVHERLAAAGYQGPPDSVEAVKIVRQQAPGLSLLSAVQLTKAAAATPPAIPPA
jgi:hypothetical protein